MKILATQRPGVFSRYDLSTIRRGSPIRCVAVAAKAAEGEKDKVIRCQSRAALLDAFGEGDENHLLVPLGELLFQNGVQTVAAVPVDTQDGGYQTAFDLLMGEEDIQAVICDSTEAAVHAALKESVIAASEANRERIAVVAAATDEVDALIPLAKALCCERVVLAAPAVTVEEKSTALFTAALIAAKAVTDESHRLSGAVLAGAQAVPTRYSEEEIDQLITAGITPVEFAGGNAEIIRAVTTCTEIGGEPDISLRELDTVLVIDRVLSGLRAVLKSRLGSLRNNERTRGAIKAQAAVELSARRQEGLIDSFDSPVVTSDTDDPSICIVEVGFTVAHGINQIHVLAHVSV